MARGPPATRLWKAGWWKRGERAAGLGSQKGREGEESLEPTTCNPGVLSMAPLLQPFPISCGLKWLGALGDPVTRPAPPAHYQPLLPFSRSTPCVTCSAGPAPSAYSTSLPSSSPYTPRCAALRRVPRNPHDGLASALALHPAPTQGREPAAESTVHPPCLPAGGAWKSSSGATTKSPRATSLTSFYSKVFLGANAWQLGSAWESVEKTERWCICTLSTPHFAAAPPCQPP